MIEVQPFIDKLDKLREYMGLLIDSRITGRIWFNANALPNLPFEKLMEIYNQTGIMFYNSEEPTKFEQFTFEEWLKLNTNNTFNGII